MTLPGERKVETQEGANVEGDVKSQGDFIGRDQINISGGTVNIGTAPSKDVKTLQGPPELGKLRWAVIIGGIVVTIVLVFVVYFYFNVRSPQPPTVALLTYRNRYVTAMDNEENRDWKLKADAEVIGDWEKFELLCQDDGRATFKTYHDRYVTAMGDEENRDDRDWKIRAEIQEVSTWEKFTLIDPETGKMMLCRNVTEQLEEGAVIVALKIHDGSKYVTVVDGQSDWELWAKEAKSLSDSYKFTLVPLP